MKSCNLPASLSDVRLMDKDRLGGQTGDVD
jgi:hypothetical protein